MTITTVDRTATADEIVEAARSLRGLLREQQDTAEELGYYTEEVHQQMVDLGLYHLLTPKRFGGLELGPTAFARTVMEIAQGDPGSGWCYSLGHGHALSVASWWPIEAQEQVFNNDTGYFRSSQSMPPAGTAKKVDGGYIINARSPYQSGNPYATHAIVRVMLEGQPDGAPKKFLNAMVSAEQFSRIDDWGGDKILGMRASGSNSILVESQFVPESWVVDGDWLTVPTISTSPGLEYHGNPIYLGIPQTFLMTELVSVMVGTARAAIDEYREIITSRTTLLPPQQQRSKDPQHQREFGTAIVKTDSAESILIHVNEVFEERSRITAETGSPYTRAMDVEGFGQLIQAGDMACEVVEMLYRSAGASAAKKGQRMQRYQRDVQMYRSHNVSQYGQLMQRIGMIHLGEAESVY
ncbi:acyl-CoA dehydrogenase family protein [Microbacterium sp. A196]|uniref:acyl-CoA dehydrogenase family protein n=1 Tax=unclassified Microbacterium TaxID=2609290 RepID=UPI003FCF53DC